MLPSSTFSSHLLVSKSPALARSPGSFTRHFPTKSAKSLENESPAPRLGGSSPTMWSSRSQNPKEPPPLSSTATTHSPGLLGGYGNRPTAHSNSDKPKDQTSESKPYFPPLILSGDMYVTVPTQLLHLVTELASCPLTPKSLIFTRPALFTSKLLGLTSLWTMRRFVWRYRRPLTI